MLLLLLLLTIHWANKLSAQCKNALLTIHWHCRRIRTRGWSVRCRSHWLSIQTDRSTGWTGPGIAERRTPAMVRHSPNCCRKTPAINSTLYTAGQKKLHTFYFLNNFVKSCSVLIIFGTQLPESVCNRTVTKFSTSPNECRYTTLWNTTYVNVSITTVMQVLNVMTNWVIVCYHVKKKKEY